MNVAKLFVLNIILGVAFILLAGCSTPIECELSMNDACVQVVVTGCTTDTECEALDPYLLQVDPAGNSPTAFKDALELKALCDSDPEDKLDLQECPR